MSFIVLVPYHTFFSHTEGRQTSGMEQTYCKVKGLIWQCVVLDLLGAVLDTDFTTSICMGQSTMLCSAQQCLQQGDQQ